MKHIGLALIIALGLWFAAAPDVSAAPTAGAPIAQSAEAANDLLQVWYDRYGRWHPNRRVYVAPPVYVVPPVVVAPICRSVRVCDLRGCFWRRRC
jgi:hypothetical protein